jgi:predicted nucleotidyltransferase
MSSDPLRDLTQIRGHFLKLKDALAVNDLAGVESATASLKEMLRLLAEDHRISSDFKELVLEVSDLSENVAGVLASRLQAFDLVIEALRAEEDTRP